MSAETYSSEVFVEWPEQKHKHPVYLTNALTGWKSPDQLNLNSPELHDEHDAARAVKRDAKIIRHARPHAVGPPRTPSLSIAGPKGHE